MGKMDVSILFTITKTNEKTSFEIRRKPAMKFLPYFDIYLF